MATSTTDESRMTFKCAACGKEEADEADLHESLESCVGWLLQESRAAKALLGTALEDLAARERSQEPKVHSHIDDELPKDHPLAWKSVHCDRCKVLVHAGNNECMRTWFEFPDVNVCPRCFGPWPEVLTSLDVSAWVRRPT